MTAATLIWPKALYEDDEPMAIVAAAMLCAPYYDLDFDRARGNPRPGTIALRFLPDGRELTFSKIGGPNWQITIGTQSAGALGSFDDCWYFEGALQAVTQFIGWNPEETAEPIGWWRNPRTGRRRTNGDPAQEYIQW